jgi:hypothetical protein
MKELRIFAHFWHSAGRLSVQLCHVQVVGSLGPSDRLVADSPGEALTPQRRGERIVKTHGWSMGRLCLQELCSPKEDLSSW